jgi:hypothetical protein
MRHLIFLSGLSIFFYNAAIVWFARKGSWPSIDSYLYGLAFFAIPFLLLVVALALGISKRMASICTVLGYIVLLLLFWMLITRQSTFVAPAILLSFGVFGFMVLLGALVVRFVRALRRNRAPAT